LKLTVLCIGRVKRGPERELLDDYLSRARKSGAALGFRTIDEIELDSRGDAEHEGQRILQKIPLGARAVRLDERGKRMRSEVFAKLLSTENDAGRDMCFIIGGADGYSASVIEAVPETFSLGDLTLPHRLARVILAEQIYRAISILSGSPYHKD